MSLRHSTNGPGPPDPLAYPCSVEIQASQIHLRLDEGFCGGRGGSDLLGLACSPGRCPGRAVAFGLAVSAGFPAGPSVRESSLSIACPRRVVGRSSAGPSEASPDEAVNSVESSLSCAPSPAVASSASAWAVSVALARGPSSASSSSACGRAASFSMSDASDARPAKPRGSFPSFTGSCRPPPRRLALC